MIVKAKEWSLRQVEPALRRVRVYRWMLRRYWKAHLPNGRLMRWVRHLRRKVRSAPTA